MKILGNKNKIYVRRKPDKRLLPDGWLISETGSLHSHTMAYKTFTSWRQLNISSMFFFSNFDDHLFHVVSQHFPYRPWIFREDNAPWHVSTRANAWKSIKNINTLSCLAQSPDLNNIENVWKLWKFAYIDEYLKKNV